MEDEEVKLRSQLVQVNELLEETPDDESLKAMKEELIQLIHFAKQARQQQQKSSNSGTMNPTNSYSKSSNGTSTRESEEEEEKEATKASVPEVELGSWTTVDVLPSYQPVPKKNKDGPPTNNNNNNKASSSSNNNNSNNKAPDEAPPAAASPPLILVDLLPNQRCEIRPIGDKRYYGGVVRERLPNTEYRVERLYDGAMFNLKMSEGDVRPIVKYEQNLKKDSLVHGMKVAAKYSGDGKFYTGTIAKITEHGCMIIFEGYEDDPPEHVAVEHIKVNSVIQAAKQQLVKPEEVVSILPTDSEEEKRAKLKKIARLRRETAHKEIEVKQNAWQAFQATSKKVKGALSALPSRPLFSTIGEVKPEGDE